MRILYITQTFPPEPGATARPLNQSKYLQELGCEITILTTMPNYPMGRIYKGYRWKLHKKEYLGKIKVHRIWSIPAPNKGKLVRMISHSFFGVIAGMVGAGFKRFDIVIASVPNIGTEFAGLLIGSLRRCICVLEQRDLIPENLALIGIPEQSLFRRILKRYYNYVNKKNDLIIVPGNAMIEGLIAKGVNRDKVLYLPHGADAGKYQHSPAAATLRADLGLTGKFVVLYSGSFSHHYGVLNYLRTASLIKTEMLAEITFLLIGEGPDYNEAVQLCKELELTNVVLTGAIEPEQVTGFLHVADVFLSTYNPPKGTPAYLHNYITTKNAEYFMAGKPLIAVEEGKMLGNIISTHNLGTIVPPGQPELLATEIIRYYHDSALRERQGQAAKAYALANLDRRQLVTRFYNELKNRLTQNGNYEKQ